LRARLRRARHDMTRRLTDYASCAGCAAKLAAGELSRALGDLPLPTDERVLIDFRTHDDAGVFRLSADTALVQTVDFFPPIVDDPYHYGQIAAANAVSDIYAMGGTPLTALAVAAFPAADFDPDIIRRVFTGGLDKLREAGVALLGGHTVRDQEIKFGYAVTGTIDPRRIWSNAGARVGDVLMLTKPIGTGIISTAIKFARATAAAADGAIASMLTLNRAAASVLLAQRPEAVGGCTDVTGFSLLGHGSEMAVASGVTLVIDAAAVPIFPGVAALVARNTTGGGATNRAHFGARVSFAPAIDDATQALFFDPQTSGGLLATIAPSDAEAVRQALAAAGVPAWTIGHVVSRDTSAVVVR
jgi:selenide,water dikinase